MVRLSPMNVKAMQAIELVVLLSSPFYCYLFHSRGTHELTNL